MAAVDHVLQQFRTLFDIGWDRIVLGTVIALASAWLYWVAIAGPDAADPLSGAGTAITAIGVDPPDGLDHVRAWFADDRRDTLGILTAVAAGCLATATVRTAASGRGALALLLTLASIQFNGLWSLVIVAATVLVIAGISLILAGFEALGETLYREREHYAYLTGYRLLTVLTLFALPVAAPLLIIAGLVACYRADRDDLPPLDAVAVGALEDLEGSTDPEDQRTARHALVVATALLANTDEDGRAGLAARLRYRLILPTGSRIPPT